MWVPFGVVTRTVEWPSQVTEAPLRFALGRNLLYVRFGSSAKKTRVSCKMHPAARRLREEVIDLLELLVRLREAKIPGKFLTKARLTQDAGQCILPPWAKKKRILSLPPEWTQQRRTMDRRCSLFCNPRC